MLPANDVNRQYCVPVSDEFSKLFSTYVVNNSVQHIRLLNRAISLRFGNTRESDQNNPVSLKVICFPDDLQLKRK